MQVSKINNYSQNVNYGKKRSGQRPQPGTQQTNVPMTSPSSDKVVLSAAAFSALLAAANPNAAMAVNPAYNNAPTRNMYQTEVVMQPKSSMAQMSAAPNTFVMNSANLNRLQGQSLAAAARSTQFGVNVQSATYPPYPGLIENLLKIYPEMKNLMNTTNKFKIENVLKYSDNAELLDVTYTYDGDQVRTLLIYDKERQTLSEIVAPAEERYADGGVFSFYLVDDVKSDGLDLKLRSKNKTLNSIIDEYLLQKGAQPAYVAIKSDGHRVFVTKPVFCGDSSLAREIYLAQFDE